MFGEIAPKGRNWLASLTPLTVGSLLYAATPSTIGQITDIAADNVLLSGGVSAVPLWGKVGNNALTNSSVTFNGQTVALGDSGTITAVTTNPLTVGTGLQLNSGTTFDGSVAKTISIDSSVVTLTGSQTLTNKSIVATQLTGTLQAAQFPALTGDVTTSAGGLATTLATVNSNVGSFGNATQVPVITVNGKGLITAVSNTTISGVAPGGAAGGDLSGTYPNPTVAKINGATLGTTTATAANILIGNGTQWETAAMSGDITINSSGITAIGASKVTNTMLAGSITASKLVGTDIATVGTITSGTWNGTIISPTYGGTGINNGTKTITLGGNLATSGAFNSTFTMTNTTSVTFPTSGTLATTAGTVPSIQGTANMVLVNGTSGSPVSGSAITLTTPQFIGTSSSPQFGSLTLKSNFAGLTCENDSITSGQTLFTTNYLGLNSSSGTKFYSRMNVNLQDNTAGAEYSSMTFLNNVNGTLDTFLTLDGQSNNITCSKTVNITGLTASKLVFTDSSKNLTSTGTAGVDQGGTGQNSYTNGQLLIGNTTGNTLTKSTLTAGTAISVTNGTGSITIANTGVTSAAGTANQVNVSASTGAVTFSLPQNIHTSATPTFGTLTLANGGAALTGTNAALIFPSTLTDGTYISVGGAGRNIGVFLNGPHFFTYNLDYDATNDTYVRSVAGGVNCAAIEASTSGIALKYAASGTAGSSVTPTTGFSMSSSGVINIAGLTASKAVFTDSSKNLTSTGTLGVDQGGSGTGTAFTAGSVVFAGASGVYSQDNSNLFWDDTNNRLGIGINSSLTSTLHVNGTGRFNDNDIYLRTASDVNHGIGWYGGVSKTWNSLNIDGPVVYGFAGGALGTYTASPATQRVALSWSSGNRVEVGGQYSFPSTMRVYESTSTTGAAAGLTIEQASTGDATLHYIADGTTWSEGIDNSATGNPFTIAASATLGTTNILSLTTAGSAILGSGAVATNATDGFLYITSCAGAPTGTPTTNTGRVAMVYDTTNNKLYVYNGAWKSVTLT